MKREPVDAKVGQVVRVVNDLGGTRMGILVKDFGDGTLPGYLPMWGYDPDWCYYAYEIIPDAELPENVLRWVFEKRRAWAEYWQVMGMTPYKSPWALELV